MACASSVLLCYNLAQSFFSGMSLKHSEEYPKQIKHQVGASRVLGDSKGFQAGPQVDSAGFTRLENLSWWVDQADLSSDRTPLPWVRPAASRGEAFKWVVAIFTILCYWVKFLRRPRKRIPVPRQKWSAKPKNFLFWRARKPGARTWFSRLRPQ